MAGKVLDFVQAATAVMESDPLSDVRISLGWRTVNGSRLPVLRLSSKSTVNYTEKAKPLGTVHGQAGETHFHLLSILAEQGRALQERLWAQNWKNQ